MGIPNNICSRNDPQLQNLLDSMRFIIAKLKKENQSLKTNKNGNSAQSSKGHSLRINNLLKENRALKKRQNEIDASDKYKDNDYLIAQINAKQLEIHRITNLNRRLKKDNVKIKEENRGYVN